MTLTLILIVLAFTGCAARQPVRDARRFAPPDTIPAVHSYADTSGRWM